MVSSTALLDLLEKKHPNEKVLVFTQFADTVDYLTARARRHATYSRSQA